MADPNHPRRLADDFKRQIVGLCNGGKPVGEIVADYDLGRSTVRRWINSINATESPRAADDRTPEQQRIADLEREQAPAHGERRFKTSCADTRTKATATAANAGRYPVSAQCEILGAPRSTCCAMRGRAEPAEAPDPAAEEVATAFEKSRGRYGAGKIKASLARRGIMLSRRRIVRIMKGKGLVGAYTDAEFKPSRSSAGEADVPNIVNKEFDGRPPRTHVVGDLAYVRVGARRCYVCLLIDLYNREIVGHAAGERKDAGLVKSAFATLSPLGRHRGLPHG